MTIRVTKDFRANCKVGDELEFVKTILSTDERLRFRNEPWRKYYKAIKDGKTISIPASLCELCEEKAVIEMVKTKMDISQKLEDSFGVVLWKCQKDNICDYYRYDFIEVNEGGKGKSLAIPSFYNNYDVAGFIKMCEYSIFIEDYCLSENIPILKLTVPLEDCPWMWAGADYDDEVVHNQTPSDISVLKGILFHNGYSMRIDDFKFEEITDVLGAIQCYCK